MAHRDRPSTGAADRRTRPDKDARRGKKLVRCRRGHPGLVLIDADNVVGGPHVSRTTIDDTLGATLALAELAPVDHLVVASTVGQILPVAASLRARVGRTGRLLIGRGPNGADLALLRACAEIDGAPGIARRYSRVAICSGDHIFSWFARALQAQGVDVLVVSPADALSHLMHDAAATVRTFDSVSSLPTFPQRHKPFVQRIGGLSDVRAFGKADGV